MKIKIWDRGGYGIEQSDNIDKFTVSFLIMPPKRKQPFLSALQYGRKNPRLNPRFQKKDEKELDFPTDLSDPSSLPPQAIELVRKVVEEKIEHGKKLVFRGLKKAKGFEKQKLVKRLKSAR
jgi:hypothetical protein